MTNIPSTTPSYPTEWHFIDVEDAFLRIDCRQLSEDTYQLRSPSHTLTVNSEGFNLFRDSSREGKEKFHQWCDENNIVAVPRDDINNES